MSAPRYPNRSFEELAPAEQARIRECGDQMVRLAQKHAGGLIISAPPSHEGEINTATYCLLERDGKPYLVTAEHVLSTTEKLWSTGNLSVVWQAGDLIFDPRGRIAARDAINDVVLVELGRVEAATTRLPSCSLPEGWPHRPTPQPGDFVLVSGYPAVTRQRPSSRKIEFWALSVMLEVTTSGEYHVVCQWNRENMIRFGGEGPGIPPVGVELGGMSGGPVSWLSSS